MLLLLLIKYVINWFYISIIFFLIIYFTFYALVIKTKKVNKIINILCIFLLFFFSLFCCMFSTYRTYRYYIIDGKIMNVYYFIPRAIKDYKDKEFEIIYSSDVRFESHSKNPGPKRTKGSKKKIDYLNIDNGKYVIPINREELNLYNLSYSQVYVIYMYKNTKLIDSISVVDNNYLHK